MYRCWTSTWRRLFCCLNTDIDGLIELANLKDKSKAYYKNLSGGLQQRLGIAIALVNDPEVVFLDEPTTGHLSLLPRPTDMQVDSAFHLAPRYRAVLTWGSEASQKGAIWPLKVWYGKVLGKIDL